jgi:hypothetical protein
MITFIACSLMLLLLIASFRIVSNTVIHVKEQETIAGKALVCCLGIGLYYVTAYIFTLLVMLVS